MGVTIHRDRTFEYQGKKYQVMFGGHGWGYEVVRDGVLIADDFHRLADVRAWVNEYAEHGQPLPERRDDKW